MSVRATSGGGMAPVVPAAVVPVVVGFGSSPVVEVEMGSPVVVVVVVVATSVVANVVDGSAAVVPEDVSGGLSVAPAPFAGQPASSSAAARRSDRGTRGWRTPASAVGMAAV
ncbi:hypothetical protein OV079_05735 [Nannocystis pusilla]|uniref:Uncharacterized protein n=1 Tax=Nannocystis pusilla TaxID=889268 RepID=A0A9X3EKW6_9BACT|nr:hypothetical protein [Nannocystis pusilla]MCY1005079.1 hypothetical protein [Nannocystis pusilla]